MLLHKFNINVSIAKNLLYRLSPYDLPRPKYKNSASRDSERWAWSIFRGPPIELDIQLFFGESGPSLGQMSINISWLPSIKFLL